jgi:hypothetical protein
LTIFGILSLISGLISLILPETSDQKLPKSLDEAEAIGKYSSFKDFFIFDKQKLVFLKIYYI